MPRHPHTFGKDERGGVTEGTGAAVVPMFVSVPAILTPKRLAVCAVPAWRASHLNPLTALRME